MHTLEKSTEGIIKHATAYFYFMYPVLHPTRVFGPVVGAKKYLDDQGGWTIEQAELFYSQVGVLDRKGEPGQEQWERRLVEAKARYHAKLRELRLDPNEFQAQLDECAPCCNLHVPGRIGRTSYLVPAAVLANLHSD